MANKTPNDTSTTEIKNNIILDTLALYLKARLNADPITSTLIDSNYYAYTNAGVLGNNYNKIIYPSSPAYLTLSQWQKYSLGQDASSSSVHLNISSINDVLFYYNASKANKVITLAAPCIDIKGNKYMKHIVLPPYASALLVQDSCPD